MKKANNLTSNPFSSQGDVSMQKKIMEYYKYIDISDDNEWNFTSASCELPPISYRIKHAELKLIQLDLDG